jgi:hypothetical protein
VSLSGCQEAKKRGMC